MHVSARVLLNVLAAHRCGRKRCIRRPSLVWRPTGATRSRHPACRAVLVGWRTPTRPSHRLTTTRCAPGLVPTVLMQKSVHEWIQASPNADPRYNVLSFLLRGLFAEQWFQQKPCVYALAARRTPQVSTNLGFMPLFPPARSKLLYMHISRPPKVALVMPLAPSMVRKLPELPINVPPSFSSRCCVSCLACVQPGSIRGTMRREHAPFVELSLELSDVLLLHAFVVCCAGSYGASLLSSRPPERQEYPTLSRQDRNWSIGSAENLGNAR